MRFFSLALVLASGASAHFNVKPNAISKQRHHALLSEACLKLHGGVDMFQTNETCLLDPESTVGPYVWDDAQVRYDISEDTPGVPFELNVRLVNTTSCEPISGAAIEIWHCDYRGYYSHFLESSAGTGRETDDSTFLRGIQFTDDDGVAAFLTTWPGWYRGRAWHIHVRVHFDITVNDDNSGYVGGTVSHVGQLYAEDAVVEEIAVLEPYTTNTAERTPLESDGIYTGQGGPFGLLTLAELYEGQGFTSGVVGDVTLAVLEEDNDDAGGDNGGPGGPGGPRGPGGPGGPPPGL